MNYERIEEAVFLSRPNRFLASVRTSAGEEVCHVKNTGRLRELLIPGTRIWVQRNDNPGRKTALDLIAAEKDGQIVNIDSQAPNKVAEEWIRSGRLFEAPLVIRPETRHGDSRIDLYLENGRSRMYLEVKGVTLKDGSAARFPDAPTARGVKHIEELIRCREEGCRAGVFFVIQMKGVQCLEPNDRTHPEFGQALRRAADAGVEIMAVDCLVTPGTIRPDRPVEVRL